MGHYIIIGVVVLLIIGLQIYFFSKTLKEIKRFSNIFPESTRCLYARDSEIFIKGKKSVIEDNAIDAYNAPDEFDEYLEKHDSIFERIISSLNTYLRKNKYYHFCFLRMLFQNCC